ncbi:zinc knuckle CX2CX4HX4C containing protein, partial [Tanacetum coccineum]
SDTGMESMLENGPWLIRNVPLILRRWSPLANVAKEDLKSVPVWVKLHDDRLSAMCMESWGWSSFARAMIDIHVPVWVKLHDVPITAFTEDRLSAMCMESWRRSSFARAIIDIHADVELKDTLVVAVPKLKVIMDIYSVLFELSISGNRLDVQLVRYLVIPWKNV